jgi:hypothetical protein
MRAITTSLMPAMMLQSYSGGGGIDPATLSLSLYQTDPVFVAVVPWVGTASAGTSGSRTLTAPSSPETPAPGASFDTHMSADYDGIDDFTTLSGGETLDELVDSFFVTWYFAFVVELDSYGADAVAVEYNQRALVTNNGANFGVTTSASGAQAFQYGDVDGKVVTPYVALPATGTKCFIEAWYDGADLYVSVDGIVSAAATVDRMPYVVLGSTPLFGKNYDDTAFIDGRVALKLASKTVPSAPDRAGLLEWARAEYAVP